MSLGREALPSLSSSKNNRVVFANPLPMDSKIPEHRGIAVLLGSMRAMDIVRPSPVPKSSLVSTYSFLTIMDCAIQERFQGSQSFGNGFNWGAENIVDQLWRYCAVVKNIMVDKSVTLINRSLFWFGVVSSLVLFGKETPLCLTRSRTKNKGQAAYRALTGAKWIRGRRRRVSGWLFLMQLCRTIKPARRSGFRNPLCSRRFMREWERTAFIRSPKCKSSRGVNHVALRLKTVGVINHLGTERRIFSTFHRVAVYITLRHFFYYFYPPCEKISISTRSTVYLPHATARRTIFAVFVAGLLGKTFWIFYYLLLQFPLFFLSQKNISNPK